MAEQTPDDLQAFRGEVAVWLEGHCPPQMRTPFDSEADFCWGGKKQAFKPGQRAWLEAMVSRGFTAPTWPQQYGGAGLSSAHAQVLQQELLRLGYRPPLVGIFGLGMLGPVLLKYGTEAQKERFLPPIVRGEVRWCQGYSEPGYGSDLAGLQTRAVQDGDHYVVNGQKVWTSYADRADWMFCLVRTDPDGAKHGGISFLLIDMQSEGIRTHPIRLISGKSPFCETFLDDVRVPVAQRVGPENGGWEIAKYLLAHERTTISAQIERVKFSGVEASLEQVARECLGVPGGPLPAGEVRSEIARLTMDQAAHRLTLARVSEATRAGGGPGPEASILKYYYAELNKRGQDLRVRLEGLSGCGFEDGEHFSDRQLHATNAWLRSRANSIEGGTSEIQLNVIAKRVLGLPEATS